MKIKIREKEKVIILDLEGNININASDLIEAVGWVLRNKSREILCNFEKVNLVDYIGISVLAVAYKNVLNYKGKMKFYNVPFHIRKLFSLVGLDRVLEYYETEEQGIRSFKEDRIISKILKKKLRRRFSRIPFKTNVEFKQKFSPKEIFYKGKVINISGIGIFVVTSKVFSIGELVVARLYLLPKPGIIEIEAKVIWLADPQIQPLDFPGMGLEFYNIDSEKQKEIIEFVEKHSLHPL